VVGRATLRFVDEGYGASAAETFALASPVTISVPGGAELFQGLVTGVNLEQRYDESPVLSVVVDHQAFRLTLGTRVRTFVNPSFAQAAAEVVQPHGLKLKGTGLLTDRQDYLLQAGNDLAYFEALVRRSGCVWWTAGKQDVMVAEAASPKGTVELDLGDPGAAKPEKQLTEFAVRASGLHPSTTTVTGWDPDKQAAITGVNAAASGPSARLAKPFSGNQLAGNASSSVVNPVPKTPAEAKSIATALHDEWVAGSVVARGTCGVNGALVPMTTVEVANAGPSSGSYVVSEVEHVYSRHGFETSFVAGPRRTSGLVDALAGSAPSDGGFTAQGLVVGVVTDNVDDAKQGRVKVTFGGLDGEVESAWARLVTLGAGKERGITFQPEVGDEVLVGFAGGDTRSPVVLGGLFSKENAMFAGNLSGESNSGEVPRRIRSLKGHMLEFGDGQNPTEQHVLLGLHNGHKLRLGADRFDLELGVGKPALIKIGNARIEIEKNNISIEGMNITVKASGKLSLEGGAGVEVKSNAPMKLQSASTLELKSNAIAKLESSGITEVKGSLVKIN
jgi:uncharacterized protein involved in type VI secretion and phage assembly